MTNLLQFERKTDLPTNLKHFRNQIITEIDSKKAEYKQAADKLRRLKFRELNKSSDSKVSQIEMIEELQTELSAEFEIFNDRALQLTQVLETNQLQNLFSGLTKLKAGQELSTEEKIAVKLLKSVKLNLSALGF